MRTFPHLFPKGRFGLLVNRPHRLQPRTYYRSRLQQVDPRFRRETQYLMAAVNLMDMRSIDAGLYCCLKTVYAKRGVTKGLLPLFGVYENRQCIVHNLQGC